MTVVTKYFQEEVKDLVFNEDELSHWNEKVKQLGLNGQESVTIDEKSPVPFMHCKENILNIFQTLCPTSDLIENYSLTPIPNEVLDLVALCKQEKYFTNIIILYDKKDPDPVVIGERKMMHILKKHEYSRLPNSPESISKEFLKNWIKESGKRNLRIYDWGTPERYLIARWGDEQKSFIQLQEQAIRRYRAEQSVELNKRLKEAQRAIDDLEETILEKFGTL
jgi:hypothetical protein